MPAIVGASFSATLELQLGEGGGCLPHGGPLPAGFLEAAMRKLRFVLSRGLLLLAVASVFSCASGHRQLKSISVSPAVAAGQTQFTATGIYSDGSKVSTLAVLWSEGNPWVRNETLPEGIAVSSSGMASCNPVVGTFAVEATAPVDPHIPVSQMDLVTPQVHGTAQLTCP